LVPKALKDGYRRFRSERYAVEASKYRELSAGQSPATMVVACADSRVDPATIFAASPGELFVVRNVAALIPPSEPSSGYHGTSAALEYGVSELRVRDIVVLGHGLCGGIAASIGGMEGQTPGQFIGPWVDLLSPVRDEMLADDDGSLTPERRQRLLEWMAVLFSIKNLRSFSFITDAVAEGSLRLHGAWFSIADGELYWLNEGRGTFELVEPSA
jgi:carbonic anhydrase